jgi:cbb3-type cytochrome oxidase subunit 3
MSFATIFLQIVCFLAGIAYLIYKANSKGILEEEADPNAPIVENKYRTQFTDGYAMGHLKTNSLKKNGCRFIEYFPTDIKQGAKIKRPPIQAVIVKDEFVKPLPRGFPSKDRETLVLLPRDMSMIPAIMRNTLEAKYESIEGQLAHLESVFKPIVWQGDEALIQTMKGFARGNIAKVTQESMKAELDAHKKMLSLKDAQENTSGENKT